MYKKLDNLINPSWMKTIRQLEKQTKASSLLFHESSVMNSLAGLTKTASLASMSFHESSVINSIAKMTKTASMTSMPFHELSVMNSIVEMTKTASMASMPFHESSVMNSIAEMTKTARLARKSSAIQSPSIITAAARLVRESSAIQSSSITAAAKIAKQFSDITNPMSAYIINEIEKLKNLDNSRDIEVKTSDILDKCQKTFQNECEKLEPKTVNYSALFQYFTFFITLLIFLYQTIESDKLKEELIENMKKTQEEIIESIEALIPFDKIHEEKYFVVKRTVNIRTKPTTTKKSKIIAMLYPNQLVRLVKEKGKWLYVEYFDHIYGIPKTGWAFKKNLKKVENSG